MGIGGNMSRIRACLLKHVERWREGTGRTEARGVGEWQCAHKKGFNS